MGKLKDTNMLAGMGLANAIIYCLPCSFTFGITSVLETLVSQAIGSQQHALCGMYLNRQIVMISVMFLPISLVTTRSETILVNIFSQPEEASEYAQRYMAMSLPGLYLYFMQLTYCVYFTVMEKS